MFGSGLLFLRVLCVQVVPLATHPYGCRVIQRALEHANVAQCRRLLEEVLRNTYHLVQVGTEWGGREGHHCRNCREGERGGGDTIVGIVERERRREGTQS